MSRLVSGRRVICCENSNVRSLKVANGEGDPSVRGTVGGVAGEDGVVGVGALGGFAAGEGVGAVGGGGGVDLGPGA